MQRDQVVGDGHDVVRAPGRHEPVPRGEPGAALGDVDVTCGHGRSLPDPDRPGVSRCSGEDRGSLHRRAHGGLLGTGTGTRTCSTGRRTDRMRRTSAAAFPARPAPPWRPAVRGAWAGCRRRTAEVWPEPCAPPCLVRQPGPARSPAPGNARSARAGGGRSAFGHRPPLAPSACVPLRGRRAGDAGRRPPARRRRPRRPRPAREPVGAVAGAVDRTKRSHPATIVIGADVVKSSDCTGSWAGPSARQVRVAAWSGTSRNRSRGGRSYPRGRRARRQLSGALHRPRTGTLDSRCAIMLSRARRLSSASTTYHGASGMSVWANISSLARE